MDFKATVASGYRNRLILIALGALLFAAWAFYDGRYAYPAKQKQYEAYQAVQKENPKDWAEVWAEKVRENGWEQQPDEVTDMSVNTQWIMFGITLPVGLYCLLALGLWSKRYVGADQNTLYRHGGVEVPFDRITQIDAARWERKGIVQVRYDIGQGSQEVLLDDWKYERGPTDQIFQRIRDAIDSSKITGLTVAEADTADEAGANASGSDAESASNDESQRRVPVDATDRPC